MGYKSMYSMDELTGWNYVVYSVIKTNFSKGTFSLNDIYKYFTHFKTIYPENHNIQAKIRQTLQNLVRYEMLIRHKPGTYQLILENVPIEILDIPLNKDYVYLVSNESIPGWIKIGRTSSLKKRLQSLYNTSVPFPFKLEKFIETKSIQQSLTLEKGIHAIIDTVNPSVRKETEAYKREFFKLSVDDGIKIFQEVKKILSIQT